jgi:hypothetical protein
MLSLIISIYYYFFLTDRLSLHVVTVESLLFPNKTNIIDYTSVRYLKMLRLSAAYFSTVLVNDKLLKLHHSCLKIQ